MLTQHTARSTMSTKRERCSVQRGQYASKVGILPLKLLNLLIGNKDLIDIMKIYAKRFSRDALSWRSIRFRPQVQSLKGIVRSWVDLLSEVLHVHPSSSLVREVSRQTQHLFSLPSAF